MKQSRCAIFLLTAFLVFGSIPASAETLDGTWLSQTGTVYKILSKGETIVGTYEVPNAAQVAAGIMRGDLAFKGTYIPDVLAGTYYQRAPLKIQEQCPEFRVIDGPIQWEVKGGEITGSLLLIAGTNDNCEITGRRLQQMKLLRQKNVQNIHVMSEGLPLPWPFPW